MNAYTLFNKVVNCNTASTTKKLLRGRRNSRHFYQILIKSEKQYDKLKIKNIHKNKL